MKYRVRLSPKEAEFLGFEPKPGDSSGNHRYWVTNEQLAALNSAREDGFRTVSRVVKNGDVVSEKQIVVKENIEVPDDFIVSKITKNTQTGSQWVTYTKKGDCGITVDDVKNVVKECSDIAIKDRLEYAPILNNYDFDRLIISDVHIGMTSLKDGENIWTPENIEKRFDEIVDFVRVNQHSAIIVVDDLGDFVDNYDGYTARRNHELETSMTTPEIFNVAVKTKITLISKLLEMYDVVTFHTVTNDNHGGSFAKITADATKAISDAKFGGSVAFIVYSDFMNHYTIGANAFILCHGKDMKFAKAGFPVKLNGKVNEMIFGYITENKLFDYKIEFSKGDSHQMLFDMGSSKRYDYCNYPSLAPASEWVKVNFGSSRSGVVMQNISIDGDYKTITYKLF